MAKTTWKGAGRRWTVSDVVELGPLAINRMNTQEKAELAQFLSNQYNARLRQFTKAGVESYAFEKYTRGVEEWARVFGVNINAGDKIVYTKGKQRYLNPELASKKNPQNILGGYIMQLQALLKSKTGTVKGWRDVAKAQDIRLFGGVQRGKGIQPKRRMSDDERKIFWRVYQELKRSGWTSTSLYGSDVQKLYASKWISGDFSKVNFDEAYATMLKIMNESPDFIHESKEGSTGDPTQREDAFGDVESWVETW